MTTDAEYRRRIAGYDSERLIDLWEQIERDRVPDWEPGKAFEFLILRAFELEGAVVRWPFVVELEGQVVEQIDGVVYVEGLACLIEAKDQLQPVNVEPISKLRNQLLRRPAGVVGAVFSRAGFTPPATTLARYLWPQTILLWQGNEIAHALTTRRLVQGLVSKFRYAVERGLPDFNLQLLE